MSGETHWICPHCNESLALSRAQDQIQPAQAQWQLFECEKCHGISLLNLSEQALNPIKVDAHQKKPALPPVPPTPPKFDLPKPAVITSTPPIIQETLVASTTEFISVDLVQADLIQEEQHLQQPEIPEPLPERPSRGHWIWKGLPFAVLAASFYALIGVAQFITRAVPPQAPKTKVIKTEKAATQNEKAIRSALKEEIVETTRSAPATHIRVTVEAIVMRAGPSSAFGMVGNLRHGATSEILESKPEPDSLRLWYKVSDSATGRTGWVRGDLVELLR